MRRRTDILRAAAALPPRQARRIVAAIAAKESSDPSDPDALLETASDAMQAALEAAILPELQAILTNDQ